MIRNFSIITLSILCLLAVTPSAFAGTNVPAVPSVSSAPAPAPSIPVPVPQLSSGEYVLGVGDRIKLTVYGEDDLSGEYEIGSTGVAALPLIGDITAAGQTLRDFEKAVRVKLAEGYLHDPRVSAQVANYRPFFILGEVSKPGSYPYVNGMTVLNAVALAGGYTYRGDKSGVVITHANDPEKKEQRATEDAVVMPGDIIRVPERFF
ncbi:MAG: polysaccharide export protein [Alphaproteobacteria bacterium]|nr:polysaccharide export protein [Alphaproteobacteria bacterium]